jgi:hypothetical protein
MLSLQGELVRDDELLEIEADEFKFRGKTYNKLLISMGHINFDKDDNKRSDLAVEEVINLVIYEINAKYFEPVGRKESTNYYVHLFVYKLKPYKLVFFTQENLLLITVVTLFRQPKKEYNNGN